MTTTTASTATTNAAASTIGHRRQRSKSDNNIVTFSVSKDAVAPLSSPFRGRAPKPTPVTTTEQQENAKATPTLDSNELLLRRLIDKAAKIFDLRTATIAKKSIRQAAEEKLTNSTDDELYKAYGLALRCLLSPIEYDAAIVSQLHRDSFARLRSVCGDIPDDVHRNVIAEAYTKCKYSLKELKQRLENVQYAQYSEEDAEVYPEEIEFPHWKKAEERNIKELIRSISKRPPFSGVLKLKVVDAKNLPFQQGEAKQYVTISLENKSKMIMVDPSTVDFNQLLVNWSRDFKASSPECELEIAFWKGKLLSKLQISLYSVLQDQQEHTQWFDLPNIPDGSVCLQMQFLYRWSGSSPSSSSSASSSSSSSSLRTTGFVEYVKYHQRLYSLLLDKFVSTSWDCNKMSLPSDLKWILNEFSLRYGVGQIYAKLLYLNYLTSTFTYEQQYLDSAQEILIEIDVLQATELQMTVQEKRIYGHIRKTLKHSIKTWLSHYNIIFVNPELSGTIQKLVVVLSIVTTRDQTKLSKILTKYVKSSIADMYQIFMNYQAQQLKKAEVSEDKMKLLALIGICKLIPAAIQLDKHLHNEFPNHLNLSSVSTRTYHEILAKDIREEALHAQKHVTKHTFLLYFELKKLCELFVANDLTKYDQLLPVDDIFRPLISKWLEKVGEQLKRWMKSVIAKENWEPNRKKTHDETLDTSYSSKSPDELCSKLRQTFKFLKTLKMKTDQDILLFAKVLCDITQYYTGTIASLALEAKSTIHKKIVIANNISAVNRHLEQLSSDVESDYEIGSDYFHLWLADAFPFFEQKIDEVLFSIAYATTVALQNGLGDSDNASLPSQELIALIMTNVSIIKTELTPSLHAQLFTFLWKGIGDAVEDYLCNNSNNIRSIHKMTAKIDHVLQNLRNNFVELVPRKDILAIENRNVPTLLQLLQSTSEKEIGELEAKLTMANLDEEKVGKYKQLLANLRQFISSSSSSSTTSAPSPPRSPSPTPKEEESTTEREEENSSVDGASNEEDNRTKEEENVSPKTNNDGNSGEDDAVVGANNNEEEEKSNASIDALEEVSL